MIAVAKRRSHLDRTSLRE